MRLHQLVTRVDALDHHFALATLFEIMDVAARTDLKSDLLKDLDRQKHTLDSYRGNPAISESMLDKVVGEIEHCFETLSDQHGKAGQSLTDNDWLMSIRSRIGIPGGTCEFDLPSYFAWQHKTGVERQASLMRWSKTLLPTAQSVHLLLQLLRDAGAPRKVIANAGLFQQNLPQGRSFLLFRLALEVSQELIPEIIGHRLMVSVRMMRLGEDNRLHPVSEDAAFELALCA